MIKLISGAVVGIMTMVLGGYIASLYFIDDRNHGNSPILIGIGVILIIVGVLSSIKGYLAMRSDRALATDLELNMNTAASADGSIVKKNDQMLKDWNTVNDQRDKLKMLEAAGAAEEGN